MNARRLTLGLAVLALALAGCEAAGNTPYGSFSGRTGAVYKKTRARHVEPTPTSPASDECDSTTGVCAPPSLAK